MADKDDNDAANPTTSASSKSTTTHFPTFAAVNKPSPYISPSTTALSKSPSPASARLNGASAKHSLAESQPMTATSSSSSHVTAQPNGSGAELNGASPYGTRSRNRTGTARPNYAEDIEMDFDPSSRKKGQVAALPSNPFSLGETEKSSGSNTRRSSNSAAPASASSSTAVASNHMKDGLPGMSSFSVNAESLNPTAPLPSRKRKAPGAVPSQHATTQALNHNSSGIRRTATSVSTSIGSAKASNLVTFEKCRGFLQNGKLKADDGTVFNVDDQIYLICEPPGEPYYLARIMEFLHIDNDRAQPIDSLRVNWFFRPRDIQRKVNDTRVVFASMQSDTCPITSLRGKCRVRHRSEIEDLDDYRKGKDSFWYEKMFDRYIHRYYEVIPTSQVINVPLKVKRVLDERWRYVIVEIGRGKDLTSAIKSCKKCGGYCANSDSVDCAVCKNTYHMKCVNPPLNKKPARGFGWSCGPCSKKQERRLEARNTTNDDKNPDGEEEELIEEEEDDRGANAHQVDGERFDETQTSQPHPPTAEQLAQSRLWPYRYLGIHCRVEDALDYDDRIYPRASSRLGPKHQANVPGWHGQPVEMVKPVDIKKKYLKGSGNKKDAKLTKETLVALETDKANKEKRPKWVVDAPFGYVSRGEDLSLQHANTTAHLQFKMPEVEGQTAKGHDPKPHFSTSDDRENLMDEYMKKAKALAQPMFNLRDFSTNFLDKALELLTANRYDAEEALEQLQNQKRRQDLKEPELTEDEIRRFEDGVARYGSELRNVSRYVGKSQKHGEIVRFYYMWKKTERGKRIWDNYEGRKGKKQARQADAKLADDVADDDDDSAFDNAKANQRKRGFECKFCGSRKSPQWRRAPATAPGTTVLADSSTKAGKEKAAHLVLALCHRCAGLWRKYGIQWENIDEVAKKVAQGGGRAWKRRIDEELLIELVKANQASSIGLSSTAAAAAASVGLEVPPSSTQSVSQDGPKKKTKTVAPESTSQSGPQIESNEDIPKKKTPEKQPEPPLVPETPQFRLLPCEVCNSGIKDDPTLVICRYCRLTVHPYCYGITSDRMDKWCCDTCENDVRPEFSTIYECLLCPQYKNEDDSIMEPPKQSHKKRTDREKEKDRLEKELIAQATSIYIRDQEDKGRPTAPRQALKPTAQRNWSHVICSIVHPAIRFGDASRLRSAEGFGTAQQSTLKGKEGRCKLCKDTKGAVVLCDQCDATVHASCAQRYGYSIGLTLTPKPKGSNASTISLGDMTGIPEAKVYCREHGEKKSVFPFYTPVSLEGQDMNALKAFAIINKSVSHGSLTGTARRADLIQAATKHATMTQAIGTGSSRIKTAFNESPIISTRASRISPAAATVQSEEMEDGDRVVHLANGNTHAEENSNKTCSKCKSDVSPKWHRKEVQSIAAKRVSANEAQVINGKPMLNGSADGARNDTHISNSQGASHEGENCLPTDLWLCHKCFIRISRVPPTPPRQPSPKPEPMEVDTSEQAASPKNPSNPWQSSSATPGPPTTSETHHRWPATLEPPQHPYQKSERLPNGVPHSSPAPVPLPPSPYIPAPHHQPYPPPPPPYPYRDNSHGGYRSNQPMPPHQSNGYAHPAPEPPSFQFRRDPVTNQMIRVPWPPPPASRGGPPPTHHPSPAPAHSPPPVTHHIRSSSGPLRSPSFHEQGPHGPPEADSNPFAVPLTRPSLTSPPPPPPPHYQSSNAYGSPHVRSRPETPTSPKERDSRRPGEGPVQNGASASPSVRNLLH